VVKECVLAFCVRKWCVCVRVCPIDS